MTVYYKLLAAPQTAQLPEKRSEGGYKCPCEQSIPPPVDYQRIVALRLLFSTRDSIALSCVLSCSSFELNGTAVTALRLKTRFFVRIIFMRDLQCGSGQLGGLFALLVCRVHNEDFQHRCLLTRSLRRCSSSRLGLLLSVLRPGAVVWHLGPAIRPKFDPKPWNLYLENKSRSLGQGAA